MTSQPSFVLVPGAWHSGEIWSKVVSLLSSHGCANITIVNLPTTVGSVSATFEDDVKSTQKAIEWHTASGKDVILVVHSYGGMVGQSAMKGFTKASRTCSQDGEGNVIGLVVIASGYAQPGMAFLDGTGGTPPPTWKLADSGYAELAVTARELFYHDLSEAEGDEWVAKLTKQSSKAFTTGREVAYPGWKDVPVWHMMTGEDKALPIEVQKMLVGMVQDVADVTVREVASSHSPMLSRPKEVVEFLLEARDAFLKA